MAVIWVLGGTNLGELDLFWMRRKIALVSQEPVLFATTIAGNIAYGREATQEEVSYVALIKKLSGTHPLM